jgi:hypothetical protein
MIAASPARLGQLLWWAFFIALGCAAFYGLIGVVYADRATLLSAGVIVLYSGLLFGARTMLVHGRVVPAIMHQHGPCTE